jgi:TatD DNase family protein
MLIDSHCHLDMLEPSELDAVLTRATEAGVGEVITISTRLSQAAELIALTRRPGVWCTVGVHPHNVGEMPIADAAAIASLADDPRVVGIGESGLDYFYDKAPHDVQQASFRQHIRAARLSNLPLVIHARNADEDIAAILHDEWAAGGPFRMLLHCFSSGRALAETALELGGYISFSGMLTFPKAGELRDIARDVPADRVLVETDAPYLAPVPHRGKRNEPSYVRDTARVLAEVRGLAFDDLAALTTRNVRTLFTQTA